MSGRLAGKSVLVSGAAGGIGRAIVRACHAEGAHVWITDIRDADGAAFATAFAARATYATLDVRDAPAWARVTDAIVAAHGRLDVVVNNAGITGFEHGLVPHDPLHVSLEDWRAVLAVNLDGVMLGCQAALRAMAATRTGSIINISSRSGLVGIPAAAAYAASKAGVRNHTKSVALWAAEQGWTVRCNSIHPAAILTPMWEAILGDGPGREAKMAAAVADTPLRRFGTPDEVAALVVHLAADESAYTTGAEFVLDGGLLAGSAATPRSR